MIDEDFNSGQIEIEKNNLFRNIIWILKTLIIFIEFNVVYSETFLFRDTNINDMIKMFLYSTHVINNFIGKYLEIIYWKIYYYNKYSKKT